MKNQGKKVYVLQSAHDGILGVYGNIKIAYSQAELYADNPFELSYNSVCNKFKQGYLDISLDTYHGKNTMIDGTTFDILRPCIRIILKNLNQSW